MRRILMSIGIAATLAAAGCGGTGPESGGQAGGGAATGDDGPIRIGLLATCEGPFGAYYESWIAGAELPFLRRGATAAGRKPSDGLTGARVAGREIELVLGCDDLTQKRQLEEARRLVEAEGVEVLVADDDGRYGFPLEPYVKKHPEVTYLPGTTIIQSLADPMPNFFSFLPTDRQVVAGLGTYAYRELGWRRVAIVGEDCHCLYERVATFVSEFCSLGGEVTKRVWMPYGEQRINQVVAKIPTDVDGYYLAVLNVPTLVEAWPALPDILGRTVIVPGLTGPTWELGGRLDGVAGWPFTDEQFYSNGVELIAELADAFPGVFDPANPDSIGVSFWALPQLEGVVRALEAADGDLSEGQRRFREALLATTVEDPLTRDEYRLDEWHHAVGSIPQAQFVKGEDGAIVTVPLLTVPDVDVTVGGLFGPSAPPAARESPPCSHDVPPPPWAQR